MNAQPTIANKRRETRAHYDRYPFGFDQPETLAEKLELATVRFRRPEPS